MTLPGLRNGLAAKVKVDYNLSSPCRFYMGSAGLVFTDNYDIITVTVSYWGQKHVKSGKSVPWQEKPYK